MVDLVSMLRGFAKRIENLFGEEKSTDVVRKMQYLKLVSRIIDIVVKPFAILRNLTRQGS